MDVHVDGNYHDASGLNRRVNLLIYLNPNWNKQWGGEFGVYSADGSELVHSIDPIHNRCVIFDSHDKSYHGLPNPINFPKNDLGDLLFCTITQLRKGLLIKLRLMNRTVRCGDLKAL